MGRVYKNGVENPAFVSLECLLNRSLSLERQTPTSHLPHHFYDWEYDVVVVYGFYQFRDKNIVTPNQNLLFFICSMYRLGLAPGT